MNNPLLSICIATYNRANFIGETLNSIIPELDEQVEVVVADGASTDNTSSIVNQIASTNSQIRYVQLGFKGGVDVDYCKAVEFAKAEMCWLFTDDDLIKPGAIRRVLSEISKGYSLILVNSEVRNIDFTLLIHKTQVNVAKDQVFQSSEQNQLFQAVMPYLSFIGAVIISRELWLKREKERYFGTEFIHLGVIFQEPVPGKTLIISKPLITIRWGNAQWTPRSFEIWMIKWPNLISSFHHISESLKKEYSMSPSWKGLSKMLYHRNQDAFSQKQYQLWLKFGRHLPYWWKLTVKTVSLIPVPMAKIIIKSFSTIKKKIA